MFDWLKDHMATIFVFLPIILTYFLYFTVLKVSRKRWKAIHMSVQVSAIVYVMAVVLIVDRLFQINILSYMIIFHLFLLVIILIQQRYSQTEIILYDGIRLLLRWSFLIFSVSYLILGLYYIVMLIYHFFI